jgi:glucose/arabinose dehydrogenase
MKRSSVPGSAAGVPRTLTLAAALLLGSCTGKDQPPAGNNQAGSPGSGGTGTAGAPSTGGSGGTVGGTSGAGGSVAGAGGTAGSVAGAATGGATSGSGGVGAVAGIGATSGDSAGGQMSGGAGGTPGGAGGTAGSAGSPGGSAGTGTAGSAGDNGCGFNGPRTPPQVGTWPPPNIQLTQVAMGVTQQTAIAAPRCDPSRIYVAEKWGRIRLIKDGMLQQTPALDIRDAVLEGGPANGAELMNQGKRGLVGLAFHPDYEANGRIFVLYVADQGQQGVYGTSQNIYDDGDMTVAEYHRSTTNPDVFDPQSAIEVLQFDKGNCNQCNQHNGGSLEVDVDGFLWASTGDPPPYSDPGSADLNNLNGKLLRFDISGTTVTAAGNYPNADPYVASIGIRNAYKFSFDRYTGDAYVGDVGENDWEEITVERYGQGNKNHEWPEKEGTHNYLSMTCSGTNCLPPVYDYRHGGPEGTPGADTCIVGGYVYRGTAIPALQGAYLYGDYGSAKVRAIQVQNGAMTQGPHEFPSVSVFLACFGEDAGGELYVCDYNNNRVLRVDAQ